MLYSLRVWFFILFCSKSVTRISQFRHISLCYLQLSCCLGLYFGTLTFILLNLEWKMLYWLGFWYFKKNMFCSKSFSPTYTHFPVSAHLFPLSSLLRRMVPEVCNLHLVLAVALLNHKSVTTFGCWFVCTYFKTRNPPYSSGSIHYGYSLWNC